MCERLVLRLIFHCFAVFWQVKDTAVTLERGSAGLQPQPLLTSLLGFCADYVKLTAPNCNDRGVWPTRPTNTRNLRTCAISSYGVGP